MTRPKVPPDQRQRIAQACQSCKRRKQRCNGQCPCNTCEKRQFDCIYDDRESGSTPEGGPKAKKQATGRDLNFPLAAQPATVHARYVAKEPNQINGFDSKTHLSLSGDQPSPYPPSTFNHQRIPSSTNGSGRSTSKDLIPREPTQSLPGNLSTPDDGGNGAPTMSRTTSQSGPEEEVHAFSEARMLQDPTGRLLYLGDAATLANLQLIRMMIESVAGPSPFTADASRHKIMESQISIPNMRHPQLLPDKKTAVVLVDSFFINTHGLVHIFERQDFLSRMDACYSDPLSADAPWLCLLNLVFAIGLILATPAPGSIEEDVIVKLRKNPEELSDKFYLSAKILNDPVVGIEDSDFWSIQALLLMTLYMLARSKRNTAFALLGMAVRSAYALGLHRQETTQIFPSETQSARQNIWRSLFVLDRFLSSSLGRPTAISEDECSGKALNPNFKFQPTPVSFDPILPGPAVFYQTSIQGLDSVVRSCSVIGMTLRRVYQPRKISTKLAQEIADIYKQWPKNLVEELHWRHARSASASQGIAILHVNLFFCHSIILLSHPFFLYLMNMIITKRYNPTEASNRSKRMYTRMTLFSNSCVAASSQTINILQNAYVAGYLPRRNPCFIYFLFSATIIILCNEFVYLYQHSDATRDIENASRLMDYCAETDPHASTLTYIVSSFRDVVEKEKAKRPQPSDGPSPEPTSTGAYPNPNPVAQAPMDSKTSAPKQGYYLPHPPSANLLSSTAHSTPSATATTATPGIPTLQPLPPSQVPQIHPGYKAKPSYPQPPRQPFFNLDSLHNSGFSFLHDQHRSDGADEVEREGSSGNEDQIDFNTLWRSWPHSQQQQSFGGGGPRPA